MLLYTVNAMLSLIRRKETFVNYSDTYLLLGDSVVRGENVCSSSSRASSAFSERRLSRVVDGAPGPTLSPLNPPGPAEL